jgi:hypothetical protein
LHNRKWKIVVNTAVVAKARKQAANKNIISKPLTTAVLKEFATCLNNAVVAVALLFQNLPYSLLQKLLPQIF